MRLWIGALALAGLFAQGKPGPDDLVRETEPNDSQDQIHQFLKPGQTLIGSFRDGNDHDWYAVECDQETVCSFTLRLPARVKADFRLVLPDVGDVRTSRERNPIQLLRFRLPKGRTPLEIACAEFVPGATEYRLEISRVTDLSEDKEVEPNDGLEYANPLRIGHRMWGQASGQEPDTDWYRVEIPSDGPCKLVFRRLRPDPEKPLAGEVRLVSASGEDRLYTYRISNVDDEFVFYPVLDAGTVLVQVHLLPETPVGDAYEVSIEPVDLTLTPEDRRAAESAIDRGVDWLQKQPLRDEDEDGGKAAVALTLAALSEGKGARERREALDRTYVPWLAKCFQETDGTWKGRGVFRMGGMYAHAIAALALAEAASNGSEPARALCAKAAEYLFAAQVSKHRSEKWSGPFDEKHECYGGWRYGPNEDTADNSVGGWCVVALTAIDAAGVEVEGMRDALKWGVDRISRTSNKSGFGYAGPGDDPTNVLNSIGALIERLYGVDSSTLRMAERDLERHLFAATQVDKGQDYPFYYAYYATRATYLRSGRAWERWRTAMIRQLVRRQVKDGSWAPVGGDDKAGPRWTTALGVMILRVCLNEPPKYLKMEVRGF
ncbi:MAG TPA: hypothetical protein VEN81_02170 [Planctomycetota bacterium]|nr:hypothetical protein [Planctomycetota bacterium]